MSTALHEVLGVLEGWCGRQLADGQRAVYMQALLGYPEEVVADVLVAWQKRNAPGSKLPAPGDVANACRDAVRGTWDRQKGESPTTRDLERSARTAKQRAAFRFIRAMLDPGRTAASKREAARRMRAEYGDTVRATCYRHDCPGNVYRGGGCVSHVRVTDGPWVAMSEGAA